MYYMFLIITRTKNIVIIIIIIIYSWKIWKPLWFFSPSPPLTSAFFSAVLFFYFFLSLSLPEITINILSWPFFPLDESPGDFLLLAVLGSPAARSQAAVCGFFSVATPAPGPYSFQDISRGPRDRLPADRPRDRIIIFLSRAPKTFCPNNVTDLTLPVTRRSLPPPGRVPLRPARVPEKVLSARYVLFFIFRFFYFFFFLFLGHDIFPSHSRTIY